MKLTMIITLMMIFVVNLCSAQEPKAEIFTADDFIRQIKKYHPVAKQADILVDRADADVLTARGSFDPSLQFEAGRKTFDRKNYYYYNNPEFNIPMPVGNLKAGVENNGGDFLSPEITKGQSSYAGVEIPIAKGLLMDKRRAALRQAKIFTKQSAQERQIILNNLLLESYSAYWQWAAAYRRYEIYSRFIDIAKKRLNMLRLAFIHGDRALMDTTEAYAQFQNYQLMQSEAFLKWKNAGVELSNYLWQENEKNYFLQDNQVPESLQISTGMHENDSLMVELALQNPIIKIYDYKLSSLEVDRKLKLQNILPYISVKANLLNKGYDVLKNINAYQFENNNKWGVEFKIPLFLREARGDYKKTQLKIKETNLELQYKRLQIVNKIKSYLNEYHATTQQLEITQSMYNNYQVLLRNEELKFEQGESSLFLVNSRESKLIELLDKQIDLMLKYYKVKYAIYCTVGILQ
ncbi:MAG: TolC family protein [Bacteroidetes bacterium]|nr:TolC family protein [Bacteroidota bacterium]